MSDKYGEWIVFKPQLNVQNSLLWILPYMALILGGFFIIKLFDKKILLLDHYYGNGSSSIIHKSVFENVSHDRCIFCGGDRTEIHSTDFTIYFSEFEYSTGSICKSCYHANAKQVKAV